LQIKGAVEKPRALSFSAKGDELSAGGQDGTVWRWSLPSGNPLVSLAGNGASLTCLAYGPGDALLYAASEDGGVRQWDLASAKPRLDFLSTADGAQWLVHDTARRWNGSPEAAAIVARIVDGMATNLDAKERRPDLLTKK
jgi:WD40 repeat protein